MKEEIKDNLNEFPKTYLSESSDNERLLKNMFRSDLDKLKLFTKMIRTNNLFNKAVIIHK